MTKQGLRELKKQETRKHISDVATGLFMARGFDNVTVAEVAEAAKVSKMTVFNYFPRKEDLFLDRHADRVADLERAITQRQPGESVAAALRRQQQELLAANHPLSGAFEGVIVFWRVLRASPALVSRMHEQGAEIRAALVKALDPDSADPLRTWLVAAQVAATVISIFEVAVDQMLDGVPVAEVRRRQVRVIDDAFDLLEKGIGDYGARSLDSIPDR
ncbi:TetR/AcrR family transcriptional regulator [Allokutzneria oryzae]|uniref:TetR/AcrR family transcriptional regulator n=1 Tax=Allokutzneria oryzae TaxID=1378989 RepID=A0ABV5ZTJ3_9PSEU